MVKKWKVEGGGLPQKLHGGGPKGVEEGDSIFRNRGADSSERFGRFGSVTCKCETVFGVLFGCCQGCGLSAVHGVVAH